MDQKSTLDRRFEMMAWGLLLIWWGLRWWIFIDLPNGTGLLGTGAILLGLNTARLLSGIPPKRLTTRLGMLALISGGILLALETLGVHFEIPLFEAILITLGASLVIRELVHWRETELSGVQ